MTTPKLYRHTSGLVVRSVPKEAINRGCLLVEPPDGGPRWEAAIGDLTPIKVPSPGDLHHRDYVMHTQTGVVGRIEGDFVQVRWIRLNTTTPAEHLRSKLLKISEQAAGMLLRREQDAESFETIRGLLS